ncbi:19180_t:CDS:2 [Cetraspora pellucida]|uniref:19180_t:CDS:1 n=1 Tax=Cetraspora pellucida TaxID=1433469 RepID=A0A9N9IMM4_9GLOM|nr:19180_t:CDS:2 [Cetraspora pellucida]
MYFSESVAVEVLIEQSAYIKGLILEVDIVKSLRKELKAFRGLCFDIERSSSQLLGVLAVTIPAVQYLAVNNDDTYTYILSFIGEEEMGTSISTMEIYYFTHFLRPHKHDEYGHEKLRSMHFSKMGPSWKFFGNFQNIEQFLLYIKILLLMLVNKVNSSELEVLRPCITVLEAENTKIKVKKVELEASDIEHLKQVIEDNAKLKFRIKELKKNNEVISKLEFKNVKVRVTKLEEDYRFLQNDNIIIISCSINNSSSNFNSDKLLPKELILEVLLFSSKSSKEMKFLPTYPKEKKPQKLNLVIQPYNSLIFEVNENIDLDSLKYPISNPMFHNQKIVT